MRISDWSSDVCSSDLPGAWDSGVIDGVTYAVPWYVETRLPFYRVDILREAGIDSPPVDWDQWRTAMAAVKREVGPDRYAILLPPNAFEPLLNLAIHYPLPPDGARYGTSLSAGFWPPAALSQQSATRTVWER